MIDTPTGGIEIEDLSVGDEVLRADGETAKVRWVGSQRIGLADNLADQKLWPVKIAAGALGPGIPDRDLFVSQQHRILVKGKIVERMYGDQEVLVPAKLLAQTLSGCSMAPLPRAFSYCHFACDEHEVVRANGAQAESLYLGPQAKQILGEEQCRELELIFPGLSSESEGAAMVGARTFAVGKKARKLLERHSENRKHVWY